MFVICNLSLHSVFGCMYVYIEMFGVYTVMLFEISETFPHVQFVAGSQPVNALAFVIDGLYYGVSDFEYAAYSMVITHFND